MAGSNGRVDFGEYVRRAPAKINLTLRVLGHRPDGYHEIESTVCLVSLYDRLTVRTGCESPIQIKCTHPEIPTGPKNLLWRAAELMREIAPLTDPLEIVLEKEIPPGAGLGGGSSDAACLLKILNHRWSVGLEHADLVRLGAQIGSDVPLFLQTDTSMFISGRGERVESLRLPWQGWVVLVLPPFAISTAAVYNQWRGELHSGQGPSRLEAQGSLLAASEFNGLLFNDLQVCIDRVNPALLELKRKLEHVAQYHFHFTGSGSTLFACALDRVHAEALQQKVLVVEGLGCRVVQMLTENEYE